MTHLSLRFGVKPSERRTERVVQRERIDMRSKLFFVLALAVISAVFVPVASADKPIKEPAGGPSTVTGQFCADFMVQLNFVVNDEFALTFGDGHVIVAGRFVVEAIDLKTDESVTVNASGPVFFDASGDGVTLRGNSLLFAEAGDFGPGTPATLVLASGTVTFRSGVPGYTLHGSSRDLCAELAA
jgi:hypothetical protein